MSDPLLPGLRRASSILCTLKSKLDIRGPLSTVYSCAYTIASGVVEAEIARIEATATTAPTADEAPEAVLDGGDDDGEGTVG